MTLKIGDRVKEQATTTGTGAFTFSGALAGFRNFASLLTADGDTTWYCAVNGNEWEIGVGTRTGASSMARTTVLSSSNANAPVNFSAAPQVFCDVPASQIPTSSAGPNFSSVLSATQAIVSATFTKVNFDTKEWDTDSSFDTANKRYVPKVPGYYQVSLGIGTSNHFGANCFVLIYKNGVEVRRSFQYDAGSVYGITVSALVYLNGTTDYIEAWVYPGSASPVLMNVASQSYFQAALLSQSLAAPAPPEAWHLIGAAGEPAFQNSFVNFDAAHQTGFYKYANRVYLKGMVKTGTGNSAVFTLPTGYCPSQEIRTATGCSSAFGQVLVGTDGTVKFNIGDPSAGASLDGVSFRVD